jgi:hypothetical protein
VKCLSRKAVHNWVANVSLMTKRLKWRWRSGWDNSQKICMLCVSSHWQSDGHGYKCRWRIYREINIPSMFEYHMLYVLYRFVTYWLTLPRRFYCKEVANHSGRPRCLSHELSSLAQTLGS